tara:strand:- start:161 stop:586 length:426 start_codon:yes stop_codon:yes gene_type:complete
MSKVKDQFYIIRGHYYTGFGITSNSKERNVDYWLHGKPIPFTHVFKGNHNHILALENYLKTGVIPLVQLDIQEKTHREWINDDEFTTDDLLEIVKQAIIDRHYDIKLVAVDYSFYSLIEVKNLGNEILWEKKSTSSTKTLS